jgi:hypothetical protein
MWARPEWNGCADCEAVNDPTRPIVATGALIGGAEAALDRWDNADGDQAPYQALFEALAWLGAIQDRLKEQGVALPPTLLGLYYLRNRVIHYGADVLYFAVISDELVEGRRVLTVHHSEADTGRLEHRFPGRDALPYGRSNTGSGEYERHVAYQPAQKVLARALDEAREAAPLGN